MTTGRCKDCGEFHIYLHGGLCKECFWSKLIREHENTQQEVDFIEQFDRCYGND